MSWSRIALERLVAHVQPGFACRPEDNQDAIPQLRMNNITRDGRIDLDELKSVPATPSQIEKYALAPGDVLFNNTNSPALVGKTAFHSVPGMYLFSNHLTRIRVNRQMLEPRYLARFLHWTWSMGGFRNLTAQWVNQAAITRGQLLTLLVPTPPLSEQRRIVEILDRADELRKLRAAADSKADHILPALFLKMFGDPATNPSSLPIVPFGSLIDKGPQNGLYKSASAYGTGTRILRIDGFYAGCVTSLAGLKRLEVSAAEVEKYGLQEHDIVINRVNSEEYLGKSAIIPALDEPVVFESNMMRISVDRTQVLPLFAIAHLQTQFTRKEILRKAKRAVNQASINQQDVAGICFLRPPIEAQERFAEMVVAAQDVATQRAKASVNLELIFATVLRRAFSGELTASWRKAHMKDLLHEVEQQASYLAVPPSPEAGA